MKSGHWVILLIGLGVIAGGSWLRLSAWEQWQQTQHHYAKLTPQWHALSTLHGKARTRYSAPAALRAEAFRLSREIETNVPPNGRTMRTRELELAYLSKLEDWVASTASSVLELEKAYGKLVGHVQQEAPSFVFRTVPSSGTLPEVKPRRLF